MDSSFTRQSHSFKKLFLCFTAIAIVAMSLAANVSNRADAVGSVCSWTGNGADNNWSTPANWTNCGGSIPTDLDQLEFIGSPARLTSVNDLNNFTSYDIRVQADDMTFTGNSIYVLSSSSEPNLTLNGTNIDWGIDTTYDPQPYKEISSSGENTISGNVDILGIQTGSFEISQDDAATTLTISGNMVGGNAMSVLMNVGIGNVTYSGNNSYNVTALEINGHVTCASNTCLGIESAIVYGGGNLTFNGSGSDMIVTNLISVEEGTISSSGTDSIELSGQIILGGDTNVVSSSGATLNLSGKITGTGDLSFSGSNLTISGSDDNDYVGTTTFDGGGTFTLDKDDNVIAIPGDLIVSGYHGVSTELDLDGIENIADESHVTVYLENGIATLSMNTTGTETIGMLEGNGYVNFTNEFNVLNVGADDSSGEWSGIIGGVSGSAVQKIGSGAWMVSGTLEPVSGEWPSFIIAGGALIADFSNDSGENSDFDISGGQLSGQGNVGNISSSMGIIGPSGDAGGTACLNSVGNVTMPPYPGGYAIDLEGTTQCTGYDAITALGDVDLNNARLVIHTIANFNPPTGTVFTLVSGSSLEGTFYNYPEGATITILNTTYTFSYTSTSATLTAGPLVTPTTTAPTTTVPAPTSNVASTAGSLPSTGFGNTILIIGACAMIVVGLIMRRKAGLQK